MKTIETLLLKAQSLPSSPGCYLMKNKSDQVIYVGKAKKLKHRVASYFNNSLKSYKTEFMVNQVKDFDFILTSTDAESYVLENNLIKKFSPKYNIRLRDDKTYPYLQINWNEDFPRMEYVRRPKKQKSVEVWGPFPPGSQAFHIVKILTKIFKLRDCSLSEFKSRKHPCLYYQMKQCSAPCVELISLKDYREDLKMALGIFGGQKKSQQTLTMIEKKMSEFAEKEEFEYAAIIRDHLIVLKDFVGKSINQEVEWTQSEKNIDLWAYYVGDEEVDISLYFMRKGVLLGHKNFHFMKSEFIQEFEEEILQKILQYYLNKDSFTPHQIVIDFPKDALSGVSSAIKSLSKSEVISGQKKKFESLIQSCQNHAKESQRVRIQNQDSVYVGLNKLKELLKLPERPRVLECYDVAIWQGISPTASQIVFEEGKPVKERYRYYHLEERPEGNNDFAMMREVISRRLKKDLLPDIFVIDGGIAQVNTVKKVLEEFKIDIPVIGIAKSKQVSSSFKSLEPLKSEERLIIPGRSNPYILKKCPSLFRIITSMRDEAHRFSRKLHHKAESKRVFNSWVDEIKGLSDEVRKKILSSSLSKKECSLLSVEQILNEFGLSHKHAVRLKNYFSSEKDRFK